MKTKLILIFLSACLAIGPLRAQSPEQGSQAQGQPVPAVAFKSENRALSLSLVGTLVPCAVLAALSASGEGGAGAAAIGYAGILGSLFGPSMGYFYAGARGRAWGGAGARFLGLALLGAGLGVSYGSDNETLAGGLALAGAGLYVVSTIWDIAGVKKAVRKRNLEAGKMGVSIAPILAPRSRAVGLQVQLGF